MNAQQENHQEKKEQQHKNEQQHVQLHPHTRNPETDVTDELTDYSEWIDVTAESLPQHLHEGMLAIVENIFIIKQWKLFWVVLDPTSISWYLDNKLRGKVELSNVDTVEEVMSNEKLSPKYRSSNFGVTTASGAFTALRLVMRDNSAATYTFVAPSRAARAEWLKAIRQVQYKQSQRQAQQLLNELQADLQRLHNPDGCVNFNQYLQTLQNATNVNDAKIALLSITRYLRQYRKIVKSKANCELAAVANLQARQHDQNRGRRRQIVVTGFQYTWPCPVLRVRESVKIFYTQFPQHWKNYLQSLFRESLSIAKSLPTTGMAVQAASDLNESMKQSNYQTFDKKMILSKPHHCWFPDYTSRQEGEQDSVNSTEKKSVSSDRTEFHNQFLLLEEIGHGAFGVVKRCVERSTGDSWAVKCLKKQKILQQPNAFDNLKREISILKDVNHPNIVKFRGLWEDQDRFYIVMELVIGEELFDRVVDNGYLNEHEVHTLMRSLIDAVAYLHRHGIAHRDLKPENILLTYNFPGSHSHSLESENQVTPESVSKPQLGKVSSSVKHDHASHASYSIKIVDFGFADTLTAGKGGLNSSFGSPWYVAPEILQHKVHGVAVDIWSIGVILYVLLCGAAPFQHRHRQQLYELIKKAQFSFESKIWKEKVSYEAKELICSCLVPDATKRISAEQFLVHPWITGAKCKSGHIQQSLESSRFSALSTVESSSVGNPHIVLANSMITAKVHVGKTNKNILKRGYLLVPPIEKLPQRFAIGSRSIISKMAVLRRKLKRQNGNDRKGHVVTQTPNSIKTVHMEGNMPSSPLSMTDVCTEQLLVEQFGSWWSPKVIHLCCTVNLSLHHDHVALCMHDRKDSILLHRGGNVHSMRRRAHNLLQLNSRQRNRRHIPYDWKTSSLRLGQTITVPLSCLLCVEVVPPPTATNQSVQVSTRPLIRKRSSDLNDFEEVYFTQHANEESSSATHAAASLSELVVLPQSLSSSFHKNDTHALVLHCFDNKIIEEEAVPSPNTDSNQYCIVFLTPTRTLAHNWAAEIGRALRLHQVILHVQNVFQQTYKDHVQQLVRHQKWFLEQKDDANMSKALSANKSIASHFRDLNNCLYKLLECLASALKDFQSTDEAERAESVVNSTGDSTALFTVVRSAVSLNIEFSNTWVNVRDLYIRRLQPLSVKPKRTQSDPISDDIITSKPYNQIRNQWYRKYIQRGKIESTHQKPSSTISLTPIQPSMETVHSGHVSCIACDAIESSWLLSSSRSGELILWDTKNSRDFTTGQLQAVAAAKVSHAILSAALAVNIGLAVGGTSAGSLIVWQLPDISAQREGGGKQCLHVEDDDIVVIDEVHSNQISCVQFIFPGCKNEHKDMDAEVYNPWCELNLNRRSSFDCRKPVFLASSGWDGSIVLWDASRMCKLCVLYAQNNPESPVITCTKVSSRVICNDNSDNCTVRYVDMCFISGLQSGKIMVHSIAVRLNPSNTLNLPEVTTPRWIGGTNLDSEPVTCMYDENHGTNSPTQIQYDMRQDDDENQFNSHIHIGVAEIAIQSFKEISIHNIKDVMCGITSMSTGIDDNQSFVSSPSSSSNALKSSERSIGSIEFIPIKKEKYPNDDNEWTMYGVLAMGNTSLCTWRLRLVGENHAGDTMSREAPVHFQILQNLECSSPIRSLHVDSALQLLFCGGGHQVSLWYYHIVNADGYMHSVSSPANIIEDKKHRTKHITKKDCHIQASEVWRKEIPNGINCTAVSRCPISGAVGVTNSKHTFQRLLLGVGVSVQHFMVNFMVPPPVNFSNNLS